MRVFINAANLLLEKGFVNTGAQPLNLTWVNEKGEWISHPIPPALQIMSEGLPHVGITDPSIRDWFLTSFFKYVKSPNVVSANYPLPEYIEFVFGEIATAAKHGEDDRISTTRYRGGQDFKQFYSDAVSQLPNWARDGDVLFGIDFFSWWEVTNEANGGLKTGDQYVTLTSLRDYLNFCVARGMDIRGMQVEQALTQTIEWHSKQEQNSLVDVDGVDTKPVMKFKDGFQMVRILTPKGLRRETALMQHCVGKGGYDKDLQNKSVVILSLRDSENKPHATLEVRNGKIMQAKGVKNDPVAEEVRSCVYQFALSADLSIHDLKGMGVTKLSWKDHSD